MTKCRTLILKQPLTVYCYIKITKDAFTGALCHLHIVLNVSGFIKKSLILLHYSVMSQ